MIPFLLLGSAFANDVEVEASATLGAQWIGLVGEDAALGSFGLIQLPGVRMAQSALEVEVSGPQGTFAEIRVEEGIFTPVRWKPVKRWSVGLPKKNSFFGSVAPMSRSPSIAFENRKTMH